MSDQKLAVSVVMIAQDAERFLVRSLDSLKDFQQVVIIDGGSRDRTAEIARGYQNVDYFVNPWPGFIAQRNFSLTKAKFKWCLMLDADEALTEQLVDYLREGLKNNIFDKKMYGIVRTEYLEGKEVKYGFGASDYQERFFQRDHIQYTGGNHHKHLIDGIALEQKKEDVGYFPREMRILHNPNYKLEEIVQKLPRFSILVADEKFEQGRRTNAFVVVLSFIGTFFQIIFKSIRAGRVGFILTLMEAYHRSLVKILIYNRQHLREGEQSEDVKSKKLG